MRDLDLSYLVGRTVRVHNNSGTYHEYKVVGYCVDDEGGTSYPCLVLLDPMNRFGVTVRVLDSNVEIMLYEGFCYESPNESPSEDKMEI